MNNICIKIMYINNNQNSVCLYFGKRQVRLWTFFSRPLNWKTADSSKIPNWQFSFLSRAKADPFQLSTFQFIFFSPSHSVASSPSVTPLSVLRRFELLIPIVTTSSGTRRRCLRWPGCSVKDFATSCETIKSSDRALCRPVLLLKALIVKRTHTHKKNLHGEMKRTATFRVKPSLLVR